MPRQVGIDDATIAAAARRVGRREGIAGITEEVVATELGVSPRAIGRLIGSREELVGLVVDSLAEERQVPPEGADWEELLRNLAWGSLELGQECPGIHRYMNENRVPTRAGRSYIERALAALTTAGLPVDDATDVFLTYSSWVTRYLSVAPDSRERRAAGGPAPATGSDEDLLHNRVLRVLAPTARERTDDREFETGIDWLVAAIGQRIAARKSEAVRASRLHG